MKRKIFKGLLFTALTAILLASLAFSVFAVNGTEQKDMEFKLNDITCKVYKEADTAYTMYLTSEGKNATTPNLKEYKTDYAKLITKLVVGAEFKTVAGNTCVYLPSLTTVELPERNDIVFQGNVFNGKNGQCSAVNTIYISGNTPVSGVADFSGVAQLSAESGLTGNMNTLYENKNIKEVKLNPEYESYIGGRSFYNMNELAGFTVPKNTLGVGTYAFYSCDKLEEVVFEGKVNLASKSLVQPTNLKSLIIRTVNPDDVTLASDAVLDSETLVITCANEAVAKKFKDLGLAKTKIVVDASVAAVEVKPDKPETKPADTTVEAKKQLRMMVARMR